MEPEISPQQKEIFELVQMLVEALDITSFTVLKDWKSRVRSRLGIKEGDKLIPKEQTVGGM